MRNREANLAKLKDQAWDLLVIGGGATGTGIALDAATRGLSVALVERGDFAAGTSSRSTKLIHGGVRYLEQAVKKFDKGQYHLVKEALHERATLLKLAPHLAHSIALVTPIYSWFGVPYFRMGLKIYDWLAGRENLSPSRYLGAKAALQNFPMLKSEGLRGGVLYYDGQFDDARMNVSLALTATEQGAVVVNHVAVQGLLKTQNQVSGAELHDEISGEKLNVHAKVVINATGPFVDQIRKMDDSHCKPMLKVSSGIHIVLNKRFSPPATGLLIPKTEDGRVLFLLPWLGHTLVGTTDNPAKLEKNPQASEKDIQYILRHLTKYFEMPVTRQDVLASWSGLRPLVSDPKAVNTAGLSRDHVIHFSESGLLTIAGGKWTTYRKMAEDAVDQAVKRGKLSTKHASQTQETLIRGAKGYSGRLPQTLQEKFHLDQDTALHLAKSYGGYALSIGELCSKGYGRRLIPQHPYLEAEVVYAVEQEMARTAVDVLARRMRLTFLDAAAARQALPRVLILLSSLLHWDATKQSQEEVEFFHYLDHTTFPQKSASHQKSA